MLKLKELRETKNISQKKLAEELLLSQRTISSYENEINEPDIETLKKIAKYFKVSVDYLIDFKLEDENISISEIKQNIKKLDRQQLLKLIENQIILLTKI